MKILCDACGCQESAVFCCSDEAALCDPCDRRVHSANKLAGKHPRFSLLSPSASALSPRCDICQEKRAFLFCREDRAILCRDCDRAIHSVNDHTRIHSRFLLTGVRLSSSGGTAALEDSGGSSSASDDSDKAGKKRKKGAPLTPENEERGGDGGSSSFSEYLMKVLPGWHIDDLLIDFPPPAAAVAAAPPLHAAKEHMQLLTDAAVVWPSHQYHAPMASQVIDGGGEVISFLSSYQQWRFDDSF